jgi:hypothetical protein
MDGARGGRRLGRRAVPDDGLARAYAALSIMKQTLATAAGHGPPDKKNLNRVSPAPWAAATVSLVSSAGWKVPGMSREPDETLEVLRGIWSAQGQTSADLDNASGGKSCKRMADVGFGDLDGSDGDLRGAWRARLEREGKLNPESSLADLVLGPGGAGPAGPPQ